MDFTITPKEVSTFKFTEQITRVKAINLLTSLIEVIKAQDEKNVLIVGAVSVIKIEIT